jgi:hypothetical protein
MLKTRKSQQTKNKYYRKCNKTRKNKIKQKNRKNKKGG